MPHFRSKAEAKIGHQRIRLAPVYWMRLWRKMGGLIMFIRMGVCIRNVMGSGEIVLMSVRVYAA